MLGKLLNSREILLKNRTRIFTCLIKFDSKYLIEEVYTNLFNNFSWLEYIENFFVPKLFP